MKQILSFESDNSLYVDQYENSWHIDNINIKIYYCFDIYLLNVPNELKLFESNMIKCELITSDKQYATMRYFDIDIIENKLKIKFQHESKQVRCDLILGIISIIRVNFYI